MEENVVLKGLLTELRAHRYVARVPTIFQYVCGEIVPELTELRAHRYVARVPTIFQYVCGEIVPEPGGARY